MMKSGNAARATKYAVLEGLLFVCLLAVGVAIRVYQMPEGAYGLGIYFDAAAVSGNPVPYTVGGGISQIYLYFLRGIFTIFGNVWQIGTLAQRILFDIGALVFYFAIRKVNGRVGSLLIVGCMFCMPWFIPITYAYGPQMLYFLLFSVGLYYTHAFVMDSRAEDSVGLLVILQGVVTGLYAGLLIYLDLFSLVLLIPVIFLPFLARKGVGAGKGFWASLMWIIFAALTVFACGFGESYLAGLKLQEVMQQWLAGSCHQLLGDHRLTGFNSPEILLRDRHIWLGVIMVAVYLSMAVYGVIYLLFKRTTKVVREMDVEGLLESHAQEQVAEESAQAEMTESVKKKEPKPEEKKAEEVKTEEVKAEAVQTEQTTPIPEKKPAVQFIENPLPLPKKHVRKTLGYAFEPDFEDMDYDVKVSEKDDFDIK